MAFENDPAKPWTWGAQESAEYFKTKSDEIRSFCHQDDPRQSFPTDGDSSTYNFENRYRGLALILNNEKFIEYSPEDNCDRHGAVADRHNLVRSFKNLGFDVIVFDDLTASQMKEAAKVAAKSYKHQEADCFVCAVLSHGMEESRDDGNHLVVAGSDRSVVSTHDIIKTFDTEELKNKPKLFFLQACRGRGYDDGVVSSETKNRSRTRPSGSTDRQDAQAVEEDPGNKQITVNAVPLYQDCLIMYGTPPGYRAWRCPVSGSWFVQELCKFLQSGRVETASFTRGLVYVSNEVATQFESITDEIESNIKKAMPVIDTMLTKDIRMKKKTTTTGA